MAPVRGRCIPLPLLEERFPRNRLSVEIGVPEKRKFRCCRLTLLAPDIVDAIAQGREPSGLSLQRLPKGVAAEWVE